jgi:outer membrane protein OmpA-like peptidoglycan-associated protein
MNKLKMHFLPVILGLLTITMYSCKAKKMVAKTPAPIVNRENVNVTKTEPIPEKAPEAEKPQPVATADYNFENILFEFNSSVLKTASFAILDKAVAEMKKDATVKFVLNGHSSAEGSPEHNMSLSVDRANSVKSYLANAGFNADNFSIKGFGETQPASANTTEEGKALNRRVEIKVSN